MQIIRVRYQSRRETGAAPGWSWWRDIDGVSCGSGAVECARQRPGRRPSRKAILASGAASTNPNETAAVIHFTE